MLAMSCRVVSVRFGATERQAELLKQSKLQKTFFLFSSVLLSVFFLLDVEEGNLQLQSWPPIRSLPKVTTSNLKTKSFRRACLLLSLSHLARVISEESTKTGSSFSSLPSANFTTHFIRGGAQSRFCMYVWLSWANWRLTIPADRRHLLCSVVTKGW